MRKAFDANVPKLKPRLGRATAAPVQEELAATAPAASEPTATPTATPTARTPPAPSPHPSPPLRGGEGEPTPRQPNLPSPPASAGGEGQGEGGGANDVLSRKDRLDKIKRKVAEASRPQPRLHPVPADPARAAESVLGLVRDLEGELVRAREREDALKADLDEARRELARTAAEGRTAAEKLAACEGELEEKRGVLAELLGEMQALEEERDASVRRAQALASLDEERARLLDELGRRADEEARLRADAASRLRAEREAEVERLSEELRLAGADGARLRAAVGELARERDQLGADLDRARGERDDLAEAKRALEAVHAALAQARARIG